MNNYQVFLDNSATTSVNEQAAQLIYKIMTEGYGNPSSLHKLGVEAEERVSKVRRFILSALKSSSGRLIYTSGGTEANNLAIRGTAYRHQRRGRHLITSSIEHPSVLEVFRSLENEGFTVSYLPVDKRGQVDLSALEAELKNDTILTSIQSVNNELGTVQNLAEIGKIIKESGSQAVFHSDAVQSVGKLELYPEEWGIDLLTLSSHKFHGPKGVGALYRNPQTLLTPLMQGGGQEQNIRPGTENVPGIVGMGKALEQSMKHRQQVENLYRAKQVLYQHVKDQLGDDIQLLGPELDQGAPHILALGCYGIKSEVLIHELEQKGIYVSAGSACGSNKQGPSHVLTAVDVSEQFKDGTIRISFNYHQGEEDAKYAAEQIVTAYKDVYEYARR